MDPVPSIDRAISFAIQEERQKSLGFNVSPSIETTAFAIKNQWSNYNGNQGSNNGKNFKGNTRKGRHLYSHCGKLGHIMKKCYKLVGYKLGYKQKEKPLYMQVRFVKLVWKVCDRSNSTFWWKSLKSIKIEALTS